MNLLVIAVIVFFVLAFLAAVLVVASSALGTSMGREIEPESEDWSDYNE